MPGYRRLILGFVVAANAATIASLDARAANDPCDALRAACQLGGAGQRGDARPYEACVEALLTGQAVKHRRSKVLEKVPAELVQRCREARAAAPPTKPELAVGAVKANTEVVYDAGRDVTWLANANLPASLTFGVTGINASGSMDYDTALRWVKAMNSYDNGKGYLGHDDWTIPPTPPKDKGCESHNRFAFGFGCTKSALGAIYYQRLGMKQPDTTVRIPNMAVKGFINFQPYLYWSASLNANHSEENVNGYTTFSFNNGFQGANVSKNFIYALPMVKGKLNPKRPAGDTGSNPLVVHDAKADVTWLANANLAASERFGVAGINTDGSMRHDTALAWVAAMNAQTYLGSQDWELPPTIAKDPTCSRKKTFEFNCQGSPLGALYYGYLGLTKGQPVVKAPDTEVGPFHNVEPYLYWSCHGTDDGSKCTTEPKKPSNGFAWSFSFGNGFQGTTIETNHLYVLVYHPGKP